MKATPFDGFLILLYRLEVSPYSELSKLMTKDGYINLLVAHANLAFKYVHKI